MRPEPQYRSAAGYPNGLVRRHVRSLFTIPITIRHLADGGVCASRGVSLDLSEGGMGALVKTGLKIGDMVEIDIQLAEHTLSVIGIVRHSSETRSGFEFMGLTPDERAQIVAIMTRS